MISKKNLVDDVLKIHWKRDTLGGVSYHVIEFCHQTSAWRVLVQHLKVILQDVEATEPTAAKFVQINNQKSQEFTKMLSFDIVFMDH